MRCRKVKRNLTALLDGELSPGCQARIKAHLEACPDCRRYRGQLVSLRAALEGMEPPALENSVLPEMILRRARAQASGRLECREGGRLGAYFGLRKLLRPAAVLATLAAVAALWKVYPLLKALPPPAEPELYMVERMDLFENLDLIQDLPILEDLEPGEESNGRLG